MEQQEQIQPKYRLMPVHTLSLTHALAIAMTRCIVWREAEEGTPYSAKELTEFAKRLDEEHLLEEPKFYMVSRDGAIGISSGTEWQTRWMFVPMEDCKERDFMVLKMREDLKVESAVRAAVEKAVTEGLAQEKEAKAAKAAQQAAPVPPPVPPITPKPVMKFCTHCGTKIVPGNKFCTNCGTRLI